ncbi:MAG: hypothetical protein QNJ30_19610 [Kiloniellales bacterium]|nr:hypothetical protein [Kiloniellales bacterium]
MRVLLVALVVSLAAGSVAGAAAPAGPPAEAAPAVGLAAPDAGGAAAAELRGCPCPSETAQGDCDEAPCSPGLIQTSDPAGPAPPGARGGLAGADLSGLARGPEPTPPRYAG